MPPRRPAPPQRPAPGRSPRTRRAGRPRSRWPATRPPRPGSARARRRPRAAPPRSRPREAAAGGRRGRLVEARLEHLVHRVGVRARLLGLELGEPLRRELAGVLLLDALEPLGALLLLDCVDLDLLGLRVLVDLGEQRVHELLLRHLLERLAAREDQAL